MGLLKGSAGLLCRPFVGALEGTSKLFYSLALASLGREGILGRMQVGGVDGCRGRLARLVLGVHDWPGRAALPGEVSSAGRC